MFEHKKHFPMGTERRGLRQITEKIFTAIQQTNNREGTAGEYYNWVDSGIDESGVDKDGNLNLRGSFLDTFRSILPDKETSLKTYIETTLAAHQGKAIGIELGGVGTRFFREFTPGFFKKSIGITLTDFRRSATNINGSNDAQMHHSILEGDVTSRDTVAQVKEWLSAEQADLIVERMAGGLDLFPEEPYMLANVVQEWYGLLREGGLMLIQIPVDLNHVLDVWGQMLREKYHDVLEVQYSANGFDNAVIPDEPEFSTIRIRKLLGAPQALPLLDPKTIFNIRRDVYSDDDTGDSREEL